MGLKRDGYSKILGDGGQDGGIEGQVEVDGPQGGTETARKSRRFDGLRDVLLDGPQRGRSTRSPEQSQQQTDKAI
jgi:hypothetical protein